MDLAEGRGLPLAEYGTIVIEDVHVAGMVKNRRPARAIRDVGFGAFRRLLTYKAEAAGVQVVVADRWFPSSTLCSQCGCVKQELSLAERTYACADCGLQRDRDVNAAMNVENYPRREGKSRLWTGERWRSQDWERETRLGEAGTTDDALSCTL